MSYNLGIYCQFGLILLLIDLCISPSQYFPYNHAVEYEIPLFWVVSPVHKGSQRRENRILRHEE